MKYHLRTLKILNDLKLSSEVVVIKEVPILHSIAQSRGGLTRVCSGSSSSMYFGVTSAHLRKRTGEVSRVNTSLVLLKGTTYGDVLAWSDKYEDLPILYNISLKLQVPGVLSSPRRESSKLGGM